jgi:predicted metal-dependent peptidase
MIRKVLASDRDSLVDWRTELEEFISKAAKNDYSYRKPNRRHDGDFIVPSLDGLTFDNVLVVVDSSGSTQPVLSEFAAEMTALIERMEGKITVVYADDGVHEDGIEEFDNSNLPVELTSHGGGGTNFSPTFKWIANSEYQPEAIVYFTDMIVDNFGEDPGVPVLWLEANPYAKAAGLESKVPPFGKVVKIFIPDK